VIDAKIAVLRAQQHAVEVLGQTKSNLEEIERETYKDREVWCITLSFPRDLNQVAPIARLGTDPLQYKRFLIDAETGELAAMKLREPAVR
jgi:hypothetical protein